MEECAYGASGGGSATEASLQASVECMVALLDSLQVLCSGELTESMISDQIVQVVNGGTTCLRMRTTPVHSPIRVWPAFQLRIEMP